MVRSTNQRLVAVCAGFLLLLGVLWVRCLWLQVIHARDLRKLATAQHQASGPLVAPRGTIYDREGLVLAMSTRVPSVFANPRQVVASEQTVLRVASILEEDSQRIASQLARDKGFVWLARHVDPQLKPRLHPLRRDGIGTVEEAKRVYPHGNLASHLLGAVDIDQKGLEGLELAFNGVLRGRPGWQSTFRDARGKLLVGPWTAELEPQAGYEVILTIDSVVQEVAEEALAWGVKKFHAKGGSLIILDPHTGQVLALANQPSFNPNHAGRSSADARRNRAITDLLEPGSVFKVVAASALLEEKLVRLDERLFCEEANWRLPVARHTLHDHKPHGWLTFHEVIKYSSNIGTSKAAQRLTPDTLYHYLRAFGFGRKTGIELPGEVSGIVAPPARWSKLSPFIIPIGQEIAVTPLQLAVMTAVVANGGWRVRPYVVERIQTPDGHVIRRYPPHPRERVLSPETVEDLHTMLISVVESGTGRPANIQGLTVAGKTGTAQKLEPTGRYSHSRYVASFVGYGPVPDPRFTIVVTVDEPRPLYFGGVVAAPVFRRVVEQLASYWSLRDPSLSPQIARLP